MSETPTPRPIRFRLWDSDLKVMIPWEQCALKRIELADRDTGVSAGLYPLLGAALDAPAGSRFVPSQYTGLDTDDGAPIYEGDYVTGHEPATMESDEEHYLMLVYWDTPGAHWGVRHIGCGEDEYLEEARTDRVVGNLWENPELGEDWDEETPPPRRRPV